MEKYQKSLVSSDQVPEAEKVQAGRKRIASSEQVRKAKDAVAKGTLKSGKLG